MRRLRKVLSMQIPHAYWISIPTTIFALLFFFGDISGKYGTYGAIITRAPGTGSGPACSNVSGTCPSQSSSCLVKVLALFEYHDPACEASLDDMMVS